MTLPSQFARARDLIGYSQDQAAAALGVSRAMISYWESGRRGPNDRQLAALSRLYRIPVSKLLSDEPLTASADLARMMLRSETDFPVEAVPGLEDFVAFLDRYAKLADAARMPIPGLKDSPFHSTGELSTAEDARRKAEEVRAHLRLGLGPVVDVDWACEMLGITVYRADLGLDLKHTVSGAFLNHPDVGFSILVNLQMTPGRRRFTIAHEMAHALFHSGKTRYVISRPTGDPRERFADAFAGEFLMPSEGVQRFMEENALGRRITDAADVVSIQRYFRVSYPTALVRLRRANFITQESYKAFQRVRPVLLARALGYEVEDEEFFQDPGLWRIARYPRRFISILRSAIHREVVSVPTAAALTALPLDEIADLVGDATAETVPNESAREIAQYEDTHVVEAAG